MNLSRNHYYQSLLLQEVDYIKTYIKGQRVQDLNSKVDVWDHGTIHNSQISIVNIDQQQKIIFVLDNVAEWMVFGIMADSYTCTSFEHFDYLLEADFEQVHQACIDLYNSQIATSNFRRTLQYGYTHNFSFNTVSAEPQPVDPFGADVPSAKPSDFI